MASYRRFDPDRCPHGCTTYKEVDLDLFESKDEKITFLLQRCQIQEKERKLLEEENSHLEHENQKLEMKAQQLKMENYQLEAETNGLEYQRNQLKKKTYKLEAEKDESERAYFKECHALKVRLMKLESQLKGNQDGTVQFEYGGGGERDGNLLNSGRRGGLVRNASGNGNRSADGAAQSVNNEGDLRTQLDIALTNLKIITDRANYLDDLIVRKLALAGKASRQANEVPMTEGMARGVTVARVLQQLSPPPAPPVTNHHQGTSSMIGITVSADEDDQVVPTGLVRGAM